MPRMKRNVGLIVAAIVAVAVAIAAQPRGPRLLVLNKEDATFTVIDPESGAVLATVPTGEGPHELVASADGKTAFASNYGTGPAPGHTISMIDLAAGKELRKDDGSCRCV
jgi:YVTN family beta-propeller protein